MDISLVLILIISILGFLAYRFFTKRNKPVEKEKTSMAELGFMPIPFPEADFKQAINHLHNKYSEQKIAVSDVFQKVVGQDYVYILDVMDQAEKELFILAHDMVAIRSPSLNLPRVTIMPRFKNMGGLGSLMDRFVSKHSNWDANLQGLSLMDFKSNSSISQRYLIFSPASNEETARRFLTDSRLSFLVNLENNYVIDMWGDMLTIMNVTTNRNEAHQTQIERSVQDAILLADELKTIAPDQSIN
jgi:hypothetical protein